MLHPKQFHVDEAWIAFQLNDVPVRTEEDGSFNVFALMDAASCFILGAEFVAAAKAEPSLREVKRLFKSAAKHTKELPVTLFLPRDQFDKVFAGEAKRRGISVVRIDDRELLTFIAEARRGFKEHIGQRKVREA